MASQDLASDARRRWPKPRGSAEPGAGPGAGPGPEDASRPDPRAAERCVAALSRLAGRTRTRAVPHRVRDALVVAAPAVAITVLGWRQRWVGDDGMVYARTVRQILAGHGPVFNVGERAEASTGALWQWLVATCAYVSGRDPSLVAVTLGVLLTGAGYALAVAAARRAVRPLTAAPLLPLGMLVLLAVKADWDYASSGLESGLATGWIALAWWYLVAARTAAGPRRLYAAAAVIGLGPLVRPGLGLVSAVFLVALYAVTRPAPRRTLALLGTAVALPAAYEVFRAGYYGVLVPLPAVATDAPGGAWSRGAAYLANFVQPYHLLLPLLLLAAAAVVRFHGSALPVVRRVRGLRGRRGLGGQAGPYRLSARRTLDHLRSLRGLRRLRPELVAPPVAGLLSWLYVCRSGGDTMHGRLLLPGLLLLVLPLCAVPMSRAVGAAAAGIAGWAVVCALLWRPPVSTTGAYMIVDEQHAYVTATGDPHPVTELAHARRAAPLLAAEIGARGAGVRVLLMQTPGSGGSFVSLPLSHRTDSRLAGSYELLGYNGIVTPLDATSVDPLGLAYPLAAHQARSAAAGAGPAPTDGTGTGPRAGQALPLDPAWIVADFTDPGTAVPAGVDPARVRAARHALTCGRLADLQASARAPLTPARFWDNLTGAWSRTGFRFPADPVQAEHALCRG